MLFEFADHSARVNAIAFTPDGLRLLTAGEDRKVFCYFIYAGRAEQRRVLDVGSAVRSISFHTDARAFLICGEEHVVYKMDLVTPEATTGLIVANPVVDRQYRADARARAAQGNGPSGAPDDGQAR
jgi:WD40 repeat protein